MSLLRPARLLRSAWVPGRIGQARAAGVKPFRGDPLL